MSSDTKVTILNFVEGLRLKDGGDLYRKIVEHVRESRKS